MSTWQVTSELRWRTPNALSMYRLLEQKWVGHSHDVREQVEWRPLPLYCDDGRLEETKGK